MSWNVFQVRTWRPRNRANFSKLYLVVPLLGCAVGCQDSGRSVEEKDACFEQYIEEFKGLYPEETLRKAAALKCYQ
jgi:hypothetical protein